MQQSTMTTWVMRGKVTDLGTIFTSTITTNILYNVTRGKVASLFSPISTYAIIKNYINPQVTTIMTYILPPITIITTDITLLISMATVSNSLVFTNFSSTGQEENYRPDNLTRPLEKRKEKLLVLDLYPPLP